MQCRKQLIARGDFIDLEELKIMLRKHFTRTPRDVQECLKALERLVKEIGAAIQVIFATQQVITLFELEKCVLRGNQHLEGVESFDELNLGPFRAHPLVKAEFNTAALRSSRPPPLTAAMVIEHIGYWLAKHWSEQPKGTKLDVPLVMNELAKQHKVDSVGALGVIVRSTGFLIKLLGQATSLSRQAEQEADRKLKKSLAEAALKETQAKLLLAKEAERFRENELQELKFQTEAALIKARPHRHDSECSKSSTPPHSVRPEFAFLGIGAPRRRYLGRCSQSDCRQRTEG